MAEGQVGRIHQVLHQDVPAIWPADGITARHAWLTSTYVEVSSTFPVQKPATSTMPCMLSMAHQYIVWC